MASLSGKKNVIAGMGEIGEPIFKLIRKKFPTIGYDIKSSLIPRYSKRLDEMNTVSLHICIPFNKNFSDNVKELHKKFEPSLIIIHSTIAPHTTKNLQTKLDVPIIYSATRGVHKRMLYDLKRYTKFFAIEKDAPNASWAVRAFKQLMRECGVKTKKMSTPLTLELAKIVVDTSYYGWLINYAQITNLIARKHGIDYDEMWTFADEIHKYLGNRPKMYPGFIGGHCLIPNLELIDDNQLWQIDQINNMYTKKVKDAKSIAKKYTQDKQSHSI